MKKIYLYLLLLVTTLAVILPGDASATTGGPTYISRIAYNTQEKAVYYIVHDGGGRGCPPIVRKMDTTTGQVQEVKSCDAAWEEDPVVYNQFIEDTFKDLPYLGSVSLKKNQISVDLKYVSENIEQDELFWTNFRVTVRQRGTEKAAFDISGCTKDQPFVVEGYLVPDSDRMVLLISGKGDCFEGGYIREYLYLVKGIAYSDKNIVRAYKEVSATEVNSANMVVYATDSEAPEKPVQEPGPKSDSDMRDKILYAGLVLVLGIAIGYIFGRKTPQT